MTTLSINKELTPTAHPDWDFSHFCRTEMGKKLLSRFRKPIERSLQMDELARRYGQAELRLQQEEVSNPWQVLLDSVHIEVEEEGEAFAQIPRQGALAVVANHPHGILDGLAVAKSVYGVRQDVKILANSALEIFPAFADSIIAVNPMGGKQAQRSNVAKLKEALAWLEEGHVLIIFPAGTVSHFHVRDAQVLDVEWKENIGRLIAKAQCAVLPMHIEGRNSLLFQCLSVLRVKSKALLLVKELLRKENQKVRLRCGRVVSKALCAGFGEAKELLAFLRLKTYMLAERREGAAMLEEKREDLAPIIEAGDAAVIADEIAEIDDSCRLMQQGDLVVYEVDGQEAPAIMAELGRLREITFRGVGEGTGQSVDLACFDFYYSQIVLWNEREQEIVGGYRLAKVDEVVDAYGMSGLYTHQFFHYDTALFTRYPKCLEVGRSFVRPEYQRKPQVLSLIWKGIGAYVLKYPEYHCLFGPVSTSAYYRGLSRDLVVRFLKSHRLDEEKAQWVHSDNPPPFRYHRYTERQLLKQSMTEADHLSALVSEVEADGKGIPVLLKHYLKLNAQVLSFNVDENFGDVLDTLVFVDLRESSSKVLKAYLGQGVADYYGRD